MAGRQMETHNPESARLLYLSALDDCRKQLGPNSNELAEIMEAAARVCKALGLDSEADSYRKFALQIKGFNELSCPRFEIQQNIIL